MESERKDAKTDLFSQMEGLIKEMNQVNTSVIHFNLTKVCQMVKYSTDFFQIGQRTTNYILSELRLIQEKLVKIIKIFLFFFNYFFFSFQNLDETVKKKKSTSSLALPRVSEDPSSESPSPRASFSIPAGFIESKMVVFVSFKRFN